jgi:hypothetical protein
MRRQLLFVAGLSLVTLWGAASLGCKPRHFETEADLLRAQVLQLETEVQHLERREAELRAQLRRYRRAQDRMQDLDDPDIAEFVPQVVDISVGRLSHARDLDRDGRPDTLMVYVHPRDSRGRFIQMVGEVRINAIILPEAEDAITIGRERFGPGEVRDAYRSGITGTHYAIEVRLSLPEGADLEWIEQQQATVRVTFIDGQTGLRHTAERAIDLRR